MNPIERKRIVIRENEKKNLKDNINVRNGMFTPKKNKVQVFSRDVNTDEQLLETQSSNLIVYHGRSWLMQRALGFPLGAYGDATSTPWDNTEYADVSTNQRDQYQNMYICWFAVGQGGANVNVTPLEPYVTYSTEYQLIDHVPIGGTAGPGTGNLRYVHPSPIDATRDYHQFDITYPTYSVDPDIVPGEGGTEDPNYLDMESADSTSAIYYGGYKADSYLRATVSVTISPEQCNGPAYYDAVPGEEYRYLNEAGLYVARSHVADTVTGYDDGFNEIQMFAKVNFSSVRKDDTRELQFLWHLYF